MFRACLSVLMVVAAGVAMFVHHAVVFALACIVAGVIVMNWPSSSPTR